MRVLEAVLLAKCPLCDPTLNPDLHVLGCFLTSHTNSTEAPHAKKVRPWGWQSENGMEKISQSTEQLKSYKKVFIILVARELERKTRLLVNFFPLSTFPRFLVCLFIRYFLGLFCAFTSQTGQLKSGQETGERGKDMLQRARGGIEPMAAAVRTSPLYMGRLLYQLSHRAPTFPCFLSPDLQWLFLNFFWKRSQLCEGVLGDSSALI